MSGGAPRDRRRAGPAAGHWESGWLREAAHAPSPNFGPRPAGVPVSLVVVHSISLPPGVFGGDAIERLFANTLDVAAHPAFASLRGLRVSAHFLIRRDGALSQFVSCDARAWHAGASSWRGRANCNDYSVGIELEGVEGDRFEPAQYQRLGALIGSLLVRYPIRAVAGHEHIAPGRKRDPGPGFEWPRLRRGLADSALEFAA